MTWHTCVYVGSLEDPDFHKQQILSFLEDKCAANPPWDEIRVKQLHQRHRGAGSKQALRFGRGFRVKTQKDG